MAEYTFKLPDLGEGTVESEIVEWRVQPGDTIEAEQPLVDMMTDKATVEITSPVSGRVKSLAGNPGDIISVGSELVVFETGTGDSGDRGRSKSSDPDQAGADGDRDRSKSSDPDQAGADGDRGRSKSSDPDQAGADQAGERREGSEKAAPSATAASAPRPARPSAPGKKPRTSPAVRRRAKEAGVELAEIAGSGPEGRIRQQDLDAFLKHQDVPARTRRTGTEEIPVRGLRRKIAEKMAVSSRRIPHFTYVEEIDVTELDALRRHLNDTRTEDRPRLTYLPFFMLGLARVLEDFPQCNAHFDDEKEIVTRHHAVHIGIATQSGDGLMVPVVRHVEAMDLWKCAAEVTRIAEAARNGGAKKEELTGSTITVTSLGALGGIVSTPLINHPEVAIIGVNKVRERPVYQGDRIVPRLLMNLSSSFDHRVVDGYDAARMIQALRTRLEHPATIFI